MYFEESTLRCLHPALQLAQRVKLFTLVLNLEDGKFENNTSKVFCNLFSVNVFFNISTAFLLIPFIYVEYYLTVAGAIRNVVLPYFILLFASDLIVIHMDYTFGWSADAGLKPYFLNSCWRYENECIKRAFGQHWSEQEKSEDLKKNRRVCALLRTIHRTLIWILLPSLILVPILYLGDIAVIIEEMMGYTFVRVLIQPTALVVYGLTGIFYLVYVYGAISVIVRYNAILCIFAVVVSFGIDIYSGKLQWNAVLRNLQLTHASLHAYRTITFGFFNYLEYVSDFFAGTLALVTCIATISLYIGCGSNGPVWEQGLLLLVFVIVSCMASYTLHSFGQVVANAANVLALWKSEVLVHTQVQRSRHEYNIIHRQFKALRPVTIRLGSSFNVGETSILLFWDTIIDKTIFLLCAYPWH